MQQEYRELNGAGYVEVADEPSHRELHADAQLRAYSVDLSAGQATLYHRHSEDTLYIVTRGGGMRTQSFQGYGRGRMEFPRSLPVRTKLWFAIQTVLTGSVRLPTGLSFFMPTAERPLIHRAVASSRNRDTVCLIGVEILRPFLRRSPITADSPPWRTEHNHGSFFVRACSLAPGASCRLAMPEYHQLVVCLKGELDIAEQSPHGKSMPRCLAAGSPLCVSAGSNAVAANRGHASVELIVLAVPTTGNLIAL